ncbi:MAG TPA: DnaB-like helicase C-terminal domain-containing protein [Burkholderiales bacterium]|nr:DnaB-like helicase C-terminal domain-containing protein [Burkholderiales bacterium]
MYEKYIVKYDEAVKQSFNNIKEIHSGKLKFVDTGFNVLNSIFFNGLQTNRIMIVAALSSVGKTTYVGQLRDNILSLNSNIKWLSFNFEMIASDIIDNSIVSEMSVDLKTLYGVNKKFTEKEIVDLEKKFTNKTQNKNLDFIDVPIDYNLIAEIIYEYWKKECLPKNLTLMYDIDHALITLGVNNDSETTKVENLMKALNIVKKRIASKGGHCIGIVLSQVKRDLESKERISDKIQHYPKKSDLTYSQALEHYSDIIIILHNPSKLSLLNYGIHNYPIYIKYKENVYPIVYAHIVKARRVDPDKVIVLLPLLSLFKFKEIPADIFTETLTNKFKNVANQSIIEIKK